MFKPILKDSDEIADYIVTFSIAPIDEDLVRDYFYGTKGVLKCVHTDTLISSYEDQNIKNIKNEKIYGLLPSITMPPLIVENNKVLDGNHRLRIAKRKGIKIIYIYDIISL